MTDVATAHPVYARYDFHVFHSGRKARRMVRRSETRADIEAKLDAGRSLTPGQIGKLMDVSRHAVIKWLNDGIGIRGQSERWFPEYDETISGHRRVRAEVVRKILGLQKTARRGRRPKPETADADSEDGRP